MAETPRTLLVGWCAPDGSVDDPTAGALEHLAGSPDDPAALTVLLLVRDARDQSLPTEVALPAGAAGAGPVDIVVAPDGPTPDIVSTRVERLARAIDAALVMVPHGLEAEDLVPRLAGVLGATAVTECRTISRRDNRWIAEVALYGGAVEASVELPDGLVVAGLDVGATTPAAPEPGSPVRSAARPDPGQPGDLPDDKVGNKVGDALRLVATHPEADTGEIPLERARRIVAGGRGIGGPEGFETLGELALALDAQVASSRPPCDSGWVPRSGQVGITGRRVAPDLYLAVGISGSVQHLAGMQGAGLIVAVNRDPDAPIFGHAHVGVVGDWPEVVAGLREGLNETTAGGAR